MNKFYLAAALAVASVSGMMAQVENRAISFTETGIVDCGAMPDLDNLSSYSLQFWINPEKWTEGATIMSIGNSFSVELGTNNSVVFNVNGSLLAATSSSLTPGDWNQITLICKNGNASVLLNGEKISEGKLNEFSKSEESFILGGKYVGLLDEVRVWNDALNDSMQTFDYFTNNTLNKWCPMWENLVAYYKMDQENCPYLVDYKGIEENGKTYDNHGILSNGVTKVPALNEKMPYLVNAAYTENIRFFDRIIPQDQYLLSNEIIILGADCEGATGHVKTRTPNNHASIEGAVEYLATYEGRNGVINFDGNKSTRVVAPSATLIESGNYSFETWLYLEEWVPGAFLFRKESEDGKNGLSLRLGEDALNPTLICRVNGNDFVSQTIDIKTGQWQHIGLAPGSGGAVIKAIMFYLDKTSIRPNVNASTTSTDVIPAGSSEFPIYVGEGIKGKMDETAFWNRSLSLTEFTAHMTNMPMPSITKNVTVQDISNVSAYYKYDNENNLGYSSHSQDEWANIMLSAYDGYTKPKISISVRGHDSTTVSTNFTAIINNAEKRKVFAQDLAEISKSYDGVELDLEWIYDNAWNNYSLLSDAIIAALPEGKTFRISTHNVTYAYPKAKINDEKITGFTFQQYGPQKVHFNYVNGFTSYVKNFLNYGYPADKILTSYSTTTSKGENGADVIGVKNNILKNYTPSDANIDSYTQNGETWYYMGPIQVYKRAKYTRENNLQGIFYWDMGNDYWEGTAANPIMPEYNLAKYCSYGINSNIDPVVTDLIVTHYSDSNSIGKIETGDQTKKILVNPSPADEYINVSFSNGEQPNEILIYSITGSLVLRSDKSQNVNVSNLSPGIYMLNASDHKGIRYKTKFVKR